MKPSLKYKLRSCGVRCAEAAPLRAMYGEAVVALLKLVAIRGDGRRAGHVVACTALHEIGLVRMPEENERRPVIQRAGVAGDLPASLQQRLDCDVLFRRGVNAGRKGEGRDSWRREAPQRTTNFGISASAFLFTSEVRNGPEGRNSLRPLPKFHRLRRTGGRAIQFAPHPLTRR